MCGWQVQVYVYCARRIPAHLKCTQCSILMNLFDICFLSCICLWQISKIKTCLCVVGPGFVLTSPGFMMSSAIHPVGAQCGIAQNTLNRAPIAGGGGLDTLCTSVCHNCCDSFTTRRLCRLEPCFDVFYHVCYFTILNKLYNRLRIHHVIRMRMGL